MKTNKNYDPKDIDYSLRETVNSLKTRIDQFYFGLYEELDQNQKEEFLEDLNKQSQTLYEVINKNIVIKANEVNSLNKVISGIVKELSSTNKQLKENQEFKDFLYNMIVHDMKNPLTAILTYIDEISESINDDKTTNYINYIKSSSIYLQNMIMNLLSISKIEENKLIPQKTLSKIEDIIDKSLIIFELHINIKSVNIVKQYQFNKNMNLDINLLERVIINLLSNAFKHVKSKSQIIIKTYEKKNNLYIEIYNEGTIIPPNIKEKIFDKFFSIRSSLEYDSGTGLGLTFCKMAIEVCNGKIRVESPSINDTGTSFIIELPK